MFLSISHDSLRITAVRLVTLCPPSLMPLFLTINELILVPVLAKNSFEDKYGLEGAGIRKKRPSDFYTAER